jgi:dihydrofolate reductase
MAKLIYSMLQSIDGYIEDTQGQFEWGVPDEEVHGYINELASSIGTYLYGRKMYEMMVYWETAKTEGEPQAFVDWTRQWQAAEKVVYSTTLAAPRSARTRIERTFNADAVKTLKAGAKHDISVNGPQLAAQALKASLVDEVQMIVCPVLVGGGKRFFPDGVQLELTLLDERRFGNGMVVLRYAVRA